MAKALKKSFYGLQSQGLAKLRENLSACNKRQKNIEVVLKRISNSRLRKIGQVLHQLRIWSKKIEREKQEKDRESQLLDGRKLQILKNVSRKMCDETARTKEKALRQLKKWSKKFDRDQQERDRQNQLLEERRD